MKKLAGYLIKYHREKQNLSQESLCKGICVVSYLSKIERNHVEPAEDILHALFYRLGRTFCNADDFVQQYSSQLENYFDSMLYDGEDMKEKKRIFATLLPVKEQLLSSPLLISYLLVEGFHDSYLKLHSHLTYEAAAPKNLALLSSLEDFMSTKELGWYYFHQIQAYINDPYNPDYEQDITELYRKSTMLLQNSQILISHMNYHLQRGNFARGIHLGNQAIQIALEEGNVAALSMANILIGNAYSAQHSLDMMILHYNRAKNFLRSSRIKTPLFLLDYNIGATYIETQNYPLALKYLTSALDAYPFGDEEGLEKDSLFLLYHKLSLIYLKIGQKKESLSYIKKARSQHQLHQLSEMHRQIIETIALQHEADYLDREDYLQQLENLCQVLQKERGRGYYLFHKKMLEEVYCYQRKYKAAYYLD